MTQLNNTTTPKVAEFSLRLMIPFSFNKSINEVARYFEEITIEQLFANDCPFKQLVRLTDDEPNDDPYRRPIKIKNKAELDKKDIWEKHSNSVSEDLYQHIRRIMMAEYSSESINLQMSQSAWQLLNGGYGNFGMGLALTLSNTAKKRLNMTDSYMSISFCQNDTKPSIHLFGFGLGVLVMEVSVNQKFLQQYGITACKEVLHELSRSQTKNNNLTWIVKSSIDNQATQLPDKTNFATLAGLVLGLTGDNIDNHAVVTSCSSFAKNVRTQDANVIQLSEESRYFSFSAIRLEQKATNDQTQSNSEELTQLAYNLAQRHTEHYHASIEQIDNHTFKPYDNIVYAMSTEGGAVVIDTTTDNGVPIQHNVNFIRDTLKNAYFPMLLLSYIEFRYLIKLTSDVCPEYQIMSADEDTIAELERQRKKILHFRLHFRYSQASQITNHNLFYRKWREVFGNDQLSDELSDDIEQINSFLNYQATKHEQEVEEEQGKTFTILGIMATTLLSVLGMFGTNFAIYSQPDFITTVITLSIGSILAGGAVCIYLKIVDGDLRKLRNAIDSFKLLDKREPRQTERVVRDETQN